MWSLWPTLAAAAAVQSVGISLWQHLLAMRFPLHRAPEGLAGGASWPTVSLLKPLKGCDGESRANLKSWLEQDYPASVQILFGVASSHDPVVQLVEELIAKHPGVNARLVICPPGEASNPKVSTLIQLQALAEHEVVVISDADVRCSKSLLRHVAMTLGKPGVGLAHCLYRIASPKTRAMQSEALGVNADFWGQVVQARSLGMLDFALGAVMGLRMETLKSIGGFQSIAHHLADDFQLGNRVSKTGKLIELTHTVVECFGHSSNWTEMWKHQLRWTRTVRICKPGPFLLSITGNATLWPFIAVLTQANQPVAWAALGVWLSIRSLLAARRFRALAPDAEEASGAWMAPLHDLFQASLWAAAHFGNQVTWQGKTYRVAAGGQMVPLSAAENGKLQTSASS